MDFDSYLEAVTRAPVDVLAGFDKRKALNAGMSPARVGELQLVHDAYFGTTIAPARQRAALDAARSSGLCLDLLAQIERAVKHIPRASTRDSVRLQVLRAARAISATAQALAGLIKKIVPKSDPPPPREQVTIGEPKNGMATLTLTTGQRFIADLKHALMSGIDTTRPAAPQMAAALVSMLNDDSPAVPTAIPRPQLLIPLDKHIQILRGEGDDVVLGLTDGTTMTGAEYLNTYVAHGDNFLEAAVFHPTEGAVNLYRSRRTANQKQRDLARAVQPVCAHPDCHHGADLCEIHHVTAWKNGGLTNMDNLTTLCRYHNRVNDDDWYRRKRGRIEMRGGVPVWVSPYGNTRVNPRHPYGAMQTLFGISAPAG